MINLKHNDKDLKGLFKEEVKSYIDLLNDNFEYNIIIEVKR